MRIERIAQNVGAPVAGKIGMRNLTERMNPGVGASGAADRGPTFR